MQRTDRDKMQAGVESIFKMLAQRVDNNQLQLVRNAYELAAEAHKEQKRKAGEPYIIHPIAVARIVAEELELGANPVMAAFLRDVVACITEKQDLSISRLNTATIDRIIKTSVDFAVHSVRELEKAMEPISGIRNVDEVSRIDVE